MRLQGTGGNEEDLIFLGKEINPNALLLSHRGKVLENIIITYVIDAQISESTIDKLEPGEEVNFKTKDVMLRHMDPSHYLKGVSNEND